MDVQIWAWGSTKAHAYLNGVAMCRKNITIDSSRKLRTLDAIRPGDSWTCKSCRLKFDAMVDRYEAFLELVTSEGDYLPPAEAKEEEHMEHSSTKATKVKPETAPEVVQALRTLRHLTWRTSTDAIKDAINILDNAGIFRSIDEFTGYDIDPEPERVSKCTCPGVHAATGVHDRGCPGDPAEWGDLAYCTP